MNARALPDGFRYASDTNTEWMTDQQVRDMVEPAETPKTKVGAGR